MGFLMGANGGHSDFGFWLLVDETSRRCFPMADRTLWRFGNQFAIMSPIVKIRKRKETPLGHSCLTTWSREDSPREDLTKSAL